VLCICGAIVAPARTSTVAQAAREDIRLRVARRSHTRAAPERARAGQPFVWAKPAAEVLAKAVKKRHDPQAVGKERKHASRPVGRDRGHNGARPSGRRGDNCSRHRVGSSL
jgi:hypothetical protein